MWLGVFLLLNFLDSLTKVDTNYFLNFWKNLPLKPFGPGFLLLGSILITALITLVVIVLFRFSCFFSLDSISENSVSRSLSLFSRLFNLITLIVHCTFLFFNYILLIMLLQLSWFFPFVPSHSATHTPSCNPHPIVHVYGSDI